MKIKSESRPVPLWPRVSYPVARDRVSNTPSLYLPPFVLLPAPPLFSLANACNKFDCHGAHARCTCCLASFIVSVTIRISNLSVSNKKCLLKSSVYLSCHTYPSFLFGYFFEINKNSEGLVSAPKVP